MARQRPSTTHRVTGCAHIEALRGVITPYALDKYVQSLDKAAVYNVSQDEEVDDFRKFTVQPLNVVDQETLTVRWVRRGSSDMKDACSCKQEVNGGTPCHHLITVWRKKGEALDSKKGEFNDRCEHVRSSPHTFQVLHLAAHCAAAGSSRSGGGGR